MTTTALTPYLYFNGNCEEAISFYREALGAEIEMMMRFKESPDPLPEEMQNKGLDDKIMHACVTIDGNTLMMSDGCGDQPEFSGFSLSLTIPAEADAQKTFNALADGGTVKMPLNQTFFSPCFGMVTDRFNVDWTVMVPGEMPE